MKKSNLFCLLILAGIAFCAAALPAQVKKFPPPSKPKPPALVKCIDVIIPSFTAALISTQVGTPGIEFPTDTVRLQAVLKNAGILPLPADALIEIRLYRNNEPIKILTYSGILGASGSAWNWTYTDTFPHGTSTLYMVYAAQWMYRECSVDNNGASFTVNESLLHAAANSQPAVPE